jgi:hypothetical protein
MKYAILLLLSATLHAVEVPRWVLEGILDVETRSWYLRDGTIRYTDKRRGAAGERGPFQMCKVAFNQVKKSGEQFWKIETDTKFAEEMAKRYLIWLYMHSARRNWLLAVEQYNAGPNRRSPHYLNKVRN